MTRYISLKDIDHMTKLNELLHDNKFRTNQKL